MTRLQLGDIIVEIVKKDIKNIHLSVNPPSGTVKIAAPQKMKDNAIRVFAISKLPWIRKQQKSFLSQARETPREYLNRESHYLWGKRYLLTVIERSFAPSIVKKHNKLILQTRPRATHKERREVFEGWYRSLIRIEAERMIEKWESVLNVRVNKLFIRKMKTKWGSCNPKFKNIRLNTELAKKPKSCLEYVLVHEMIHLLERKHNKRFSALMNEHHPHWKREKRILNSLPTQTFLDDGH